MYKQEGPLRFSSVGVLSILVIHLICFKLIGHSSPDFHAILELEDLRAVVLDHHYVDECQPHSFIEFLNQILAGLQLCDECSQLLYMGPTLLFLLFDLLDPVALGLILCDIVA